MENRGTRVIARVARFLNLIAVLATGSAMVMVTVDVLLRYFFAKPIPGGVNLSEFLLVAMIALPLAYCQLTGSHIRVDVFIEKIRGRPRELMELLTLLAALVLFGMATYTEILETARAFTTGDYVLGIVQYPIWPVKIMIPIGTGCLCLRLMVEVAEHGRNLFSPRKAMEIKKAAEAL